MVSARPGCRKSKGWHDLNPLTVFAALHEAGIENFFCRHVVGIGPAILRNRTNSLKAERMRRRTPGGSRWFRGRVRSALPKLALFRS